MNNCQKCGIETANPKYCSRSCAVSKNNLGVRRNIKKYPPKESICADCERYFFWTEGKKHSMFCLECQQKRCSENKTFGYYKDYYGSGGAGLRIAHVHIRNIARRTIKTNDCFCKNCGYEKHVELCHIKPVSQFPDSALLSEINCPDNLVVLCRNCHWELDHQLLIL